MATMTMRKMWIPTKDIFGIQSNGCGLAFIYERKRAMICDDCVLVEVGLYCISPTSRRVLGVELTFEIDR
ncbi:unnamed protein product [Taenia asiatica]|uniref:Uncharacterized protein n=1 Tax=Taenia asiatica TaxID=60517 RepID=A0A0R3VWH4_TAEAS|nr:unnamed protein product [Taenia asiatica]